MKRGQASILLVLAIIILITLSLAYFFKTSLPKTIKLEPIKSSISETLRLNIQNCLSNTAELALSNLGLKGGYIETPNKFITINNSIISFGYYKNSVILNSLEGLKTEINNYIESNLPKCIKNKNLISEEGKVISKTIINKDNINIEINYPVTIKQGDRIDSLNPEYKTELKIRLGYIYDFVLSILSKNLKDPINIDIANLLKSDLTIDIVGYKNNILIYLITDKKSKINNKPFNFIFANYFGT